MFLKATMLNKRSITLSTMFLLFHQTTPNSVTRQWKVVQFSFITKNSVAPASGFATNGFRTKKMNEKTYSFF